MVSLPGLRTRKTVPARSSGELDAMAAAGSVVAAALRAVADATRPGVSTKDLDEIAETVIREAGGIPSFLGYHGYPASICSSVNDRVVHGIPSAEEVLAYGDLVSIDCGAIIDSWHGDAAVTLGVGELIPADEALSAATRAAMEAGIAAMVVGNRLTDVSHAIEKGTRAAEQTYDGSGSSRGTAATASVRACTWIRFCPMKVSPAADHCWWPALCWPSSRCCRWVPPEPAFLRTTGPWSPPTARGQHTGSTLSR